MAEYKSAARRSQHQTPKGRDAEPDLIKPNAIDTGTVNPTLGRCILLDVRGLGGVTIRGFRKECVRSSAVA